MIMDYLQWIDSLSTADCEHFIEAEQTAQEDYFANRIRKAEYAAKKSREYEIRYISRLVRTNPGKTFDERYEYHQTVIWPLISKVMTNYKKFVITLEDEEDGEDEEDDEDKAIDEMSDKLKTLTISNTVDPEKEQMARIMIESYKASWKNTCMRMTSHIQPDDDAMEICSD